MKLKIILVTLGILLIAGGFWLKGQLTQTELELPPGDPIVYEQLDYVMRGQFDYLYVYADGKVVYVQEKGLRMVTQGQHPTRTWSTGQLTAAGLEQLLGLFRGSAFADLQDQYQSAEPQPGDMVMLVTVNTSDVAKSVTASHYATPDQDATYPGMPAPLNDIYVALRAIAAGTTEVATRSISQ